MQLVQPDRDRNGRIRKLIAQRMRGGVPPWQHQNDRLYSREHEWVLTQGSIWAWVAGRGQAVERA